MYFYYCTVYTISRLYFVLVIMPTLNCTQVETLLPGRAPTFYTFSVHLSMSVTVHILCLTNSLIVGLHNLRHLKVGNKTYPLRIFLSFFLS
jgi:hypothetical protein